VATTAKRQLSVNWQSGNNLVKYLAVPPLQDTPSPWSSRGVSGLRIASYDYGTMITTKYHSLYGQLIGMTFSGAS